MLQYNQTICKKGRAVDAASRGDKPTPAQTIFQTYLSGLCRESSLSCRGPRIGSGGPRWAPLAVSSWGPLGVQSFRVPCGATNGNPQWHGWHTRLALATGAARLINKDAEGRAPFNVEGLPGTKAWRRFRQRSRMPNWHGKESAGDNVIDRSICLK